MYGKGGIMKEAKRICVSVPRSLLEEMDSMAESEDTSRSEFIRDAVRSYIHSRQLYDLRESLREGYENMASLNLKLAEACIDVENESSEVLLENLTGGGDVADL